MQRGAKLVRPLLELPVVLFSEAICAWLVLPVGIRMVGRCRQSCDPKLRKLLLLRPNEPVSHSSASYLWQHLQIVQLKERNGTYWRAGELILDQSLHFGPLHTAF